MSVVFLILAPSSYIVEKPGIAVNVLRNYKEDQVIKISPNHKINKSNKKPSYANYDLQSNNTTQQILLLTVSVYGGPQTYASSLITIPSLFTNTDTIYPSSVLYPPSTTSEEVEEENTSQMSSAKDASVLAAITYAKNMLKDDNLADAIEESTIDINAKQIGGPSGGLAFTLGILSKFNVKLGSSSIIACTGTIDKNGKVGPIGGIKQKVQTAINYHAKIMLVPTDNYYEIKNFPKDLEIIPIDNLAQAIKVLNQK